MDLFHLSVSTLFCAAGSRGGCPSPFPAFWSEPVCQCFTSLSCGWELRKAKQQEFEMPGASVKGDGREELEIPLKQVEEDFALNAKTDFAYQLN